MFIEGIIRAKFLPTYGTFYNSHIEVTAHRRIKMLQVKGDEAYPFRTGISSVQSLKFFGKNLVISGPEILRNCM
jgi:hypothetical protein